MKSATYILITIFFIVTNCSNRSKKNCDEVTLDGYLVTRLVRSEVESYYANKKRKESGKPYSIALDSHHESYFIPSDSVDSHAKLLSLVINHKHYYDKRVFFLPNPETKANIARFCSKQIDGEIPEYQLSTEIYLEIVADPAPKYLYNIQFLRGNSIYSRIDNTFFNKRYLGVPAIDAGLLQFECYFIYSMSLEDDINLGDGFKRIELASDDRL